MAEQPVTSALFMDRADPLGNSLDDSGRRALHVKSQGGTVTANFRGLSIAGRITVVTLNQNTWTAVPAVPLANRNSLLVQNNSTLYTVLWNYSASAPTNEGFQIVPQGYKEVAITPSIVVYCKLLGSGAATADVVVEELS